MKRLFDRLDRKLEWTLVPPQPDPVAGCDRSVPLRPDLLKRVIQLRADMGLTPEQAETRHSFSAAGGWHLIVTDLSGEIAGTVRLVVIDRQREPLSPADIVHVGHVDFPSDAVRDQHLLALQRLFDEKTQERFFIAPGGIFTTASWRGSGLAAALGAAAIAMARLFGSRLSASFTVVRGQTQDLFTSFGGRPPSLPDGEPIAPFLCQRHGIPVQLLVFDSRHPGPRAEAGVQLMADRLLALMPAQLMPAQEQAA